MENNVKEEILKNLKVICATKLFIAKKIDNKNDIEKFLVINDILNTENAFNKIDMEIAINIINDLVDNFDKAKEIYLQILA